MGGPESRQVMKARPAQPVFLCVASNKGIYKNMKDRGGNENRKTGRDSRRSMRDRGGKMSTNEIEGTKRIGGINTMTNRGGAKRRQRADP